MLVRIAAVVVAGASVFAAVSSYRMDRAVTKTLLRAPSPSVPPLTEQELVGFRTLWREIIDRSTNSRPWGLLSDGAGQVAQGTHPARVRRPGRQAPQSRHCHHRAAVPHQGQAHRQRQGTGHRHRAGAGWRPAFLPPDVPSGGRPSDGPAPGQADVAAFAGDGVVGHGRSLTAANGPGTMSSACKRSPLPWSR